MTREEAISLLRAGIARLPRGTARADAFDAVDRLTFAFHVDTPEGLVRQAYHTVVLAVPEHKAAADQLLADCTGPSREPKP